MKFGVCLFDIIQPGVINLRLVVIFEPQHIKPKRYGLSTVWSKILLYNYYTVNHKNVTFYFDYNFG